MKQEAPAADDPDLSYYINWVNHDMQMDPQRISYFARVLIRSEKSILVSAKFG